MTDSTGNLRQRKRSKKGKQKESTQQEDSSSPDSTQQQPQDDDDDQQSMWQVFVSHPLGYCLTRVLPLVAIPYGIYVTYLYLVLQHPEWISSNLRPAVGVSDKRQVLIVGTMSTGTVQVSKELSNKLHLEIGHEEVDAQWNFVRDGTVSWFHGIRFLPPLVNNTEKMRVLRNICLQYSPNMGFHPRMYRPSNCSSRQAKWNQCWARECMEIITQEWNCASHQNCETPFKYTLLQVRNPLRTIESLVAKFCQGDLEDGSVHLSFTQLLEALFGITEELSCIEAAALYVVKYTNALLQAYKESLIDGVYKIEEATPCHVAKLAGLLRNETTLYEPNYKRVVERCNPDNPTAAQELMEASSHQINVDLVKLTWSDLEGGKHGSQRQEGDEELVQDVKDLFVKLGYDADNEEDANDPVFDF